MDSLKQYTVTQLLEELQRRKFEVVAAKSCATCKHRTCIFRKENSFCSDYAK